MIKVKKSLSFLVIACIILSNLVFAQSASGNVSAAGNSDGINFEGQFSGSSGSGIGSGEMSKGSMNQAPTEDQMRQMAKEKMGKEFSEEKFQKMMQEYKIKSAGKNEFSYDQQGTEHRYDAGPSYEGYSKENIIFAMVFEQIGNDIDPRDIKQFCSEPNKIADIILSKLKAKVGDVQSLCGKISEKESNCDESSKKMCSQIGTAVFSSNSNEMEKVQSVAFSCPVNKDAIVQSCLLRSKSYMEQQMNNMEQSCEQKATSNAGNIAKECETFKSRQVCDKDSFVKQCLNNLGAKKDDFDDSGKRKIVCPQYPAPACGENSKLETKTDSNGCQYYYCVQTTSQCPPQTQPACAQGQSIQKKTDEKGCIYYYCGDSAITCPETAQPTCAANTHLERKTDDKGCISYYCAANPCLAVTKPSCNTGETIQAYYDNAGCVTSYQCIKQQPVCPEVQKPTCSDRQSVATKYDSNNCPSYECVTITSSSNSSGVTGAVVLNTYDDYVKQCESNWIQQEKICSSMQSNCDKTNFAERCKENAKKSYDEFQSRVEETCKSQTQSQILAAEDRCSRIDKERSKCSEQVEKRCAQMKGLSEKCKSTLTEENLRKFIIEEATKRCKFSDKLENKDELKKSDKAEIILAVLNTASQSDFDKLKLFVDDLKEDLKLQDTTVYKGTINPNNFGNIKLLPFVVNAKISTSASSEKSKEVKEKIVASQKVEDTASKLASLRDSNVPSQYLYIIEDKANDVLNVSNKLGDLEKKDGQKGIGYKMKLFFGLAKQAEQDEIKQLQESKSKLQNSIDTLTKLVDDVPSDVAKAILKEQVENLKKQQADIQILIDAKQKKAKGFFGLFG